MRKKKYKLYLIKVTTQPYLESLLFTLKQKEKKKKDLNFFYPFLFEYFKKLHFE